jgi:hypothetical protein
MEGELPKVTQLCDMFDRGVSGLQPVRYVRKLFGYDRPEDVAVVWVDHDPEPDWTYGPETWESPIADPGQKTMFHEMTAADPAHVEVVLLEAKFLKYPGSLVPGLHVRYPNLKHVIVEVSMMWDGVDDGPVPLAELLFRGLNLRSLWMYSGTKWFRPPPQDMFASSDGFVVRHDKRYTFEVASRVGIVKRCGRL